MGFAALYPSYTPTHPTRFLIQPEFGDVSRIGAQLFSLDARDEVGQNGIGAAGEADLGAFAHHKTVHEIDLGTPPLLHVLAHRRPLFGGDAFAISKALFVAGANRVLVALAGARDRLRWQM